MNIDRFDNEVPSQPVQPEAPFELPAEEVYEDRLGRSFAIGCAGLLLFLCIGAALYMMQPGRLSSLITGLPPNLFPGLSRALGTPGSTPTIMPFTPGNPTATPLGSDITDPNFIKGVAAYQAKNYEEVVTLMDAVIKASPGLAPPYRYRGMAYWYLQDCRSGLADVEKALAINPNYPVGWADRGLMKDCLGDETQALLDYQKALSLDPSLAFVHQNLGVYYYGKGDYERSLDEYSLSAAIDPTRAGAWSGRNRALMKLGRYQECIDGTTRSVTLDPKNWTALADRAICEMEMGKYTESIEDYKIVTANIEDNSIDLYNMGVDYGHRGDLYYKSKQYELAIADYKMAVKLIVGDAHSYCQLSYSDFEVGDYQGALEAAKSSIAINPACGGQKLLDVMGRSSYALGDYDQAVEYMDQALAKGEYPLGYYYRGISYQAAGKKQEAIGDLKRFLAYHPTGKEADDARARLVKLGSDEVGRLEDQGPAGHALSGKGI